MDNKIVKVPSVKGIGGAFKDFGVGALGGGILALAVSLFGPLGFIAAPLLAGSMIKSDNGKVITTLSGAALGMALLAGFFGGGSSSQSSSNTGTM